MDMEIINAGEGDISEMLAKKIEERVNGRDRFDILFITDGASRLATIRGIDAMEDFRRFYSGVADISVVCMDSDRVVSLGTDLSKYNVVWLDNVANPALNRYISEFLVGYTEELLPEWQKGTEELSDEEKGKYYAEVSEYRALHCRIVYALDEFIWEGPGGRQNTVMYVKTVEDAAAISDEVVVPNAEMAKAIREFGFLGDKEMVVVPTFMSERFFPVHRVNKKSSSYASTIRKPRILVKGLTIPKAVQDYIVYDSDKIDFTVSTGGDLEDKLIELLGKKTVRNIVHWSNPVINERNIVTTMSVERDSRFDFVILTMPDKVDDSIYSVTDVDTDALMAIASGAVAIAEIDDIGYGTGTHVCQETGMTFGKDIKVDELRKMITKWSICVNWDSAYEKQRKLLDQRLAQSEPVMGGYFNAMLGKRVSEARMKTLKAMMEKAK